MTLQQRPNRRRHARPRGLTHIDLVVLVLCVGLGVLVGCLSRGGNRETANRVKCASNLRQIGQAMLLYANDHNGAYPRVIFVAGPDPKPVWGTADQPNDVTATMFLLLRTQDITPEVFNCPSSSTDADPFGGGGTNATRSRTNFSDIKKHLAYSMHNPYVRDGVVPAEDKTYWTSGMSAGFPVAADVNPGTAGGDDVTKATVNLSARDMKVSNSSNHDKDGQNILYGDGHVSWESNPLVGIERENIYTTRDGKLAASPLDVNDSVLLPTDD